MRLVSLLVVSLLATCVNASAFFGRKNSLILSPLSRCSVKILPEGDTTGRSSIFRNSNANTKRGRWPSFRGGARGSIKASCADSDKTLALKAGLSALLETAGMLGVIAGAKEAASRINIPFLTKLVNGLPVLQWASLVFVVFSSSTIKSWIDGGVSVATNQVLKPNAIPGDSEWYDSLKKPWFNPPSWLFPIMWVLVSKPTQLMAVSRILKVSPVPWPTLAVYCAHLSLGDVWNQVFFGCQRIKLGAGVITTFYGVLLTSAKLFYDVDPDAGLLLLPTCGWVTVATALNLAIYRLNKEDED